MDRKIDGMVSGLGLLAMVLLPVLRSGRLPEVLARFGQVEPAWPGFRAIFGYFVLGIQMIPAFWFSCLAEHGLTNLLLLAAIAVLVIVIRKCVEKEAEEHI